MGVVGQPLNMGPFSLAPLAYQVGGEKNKKPKSKAREGRVLP